MLRHSSPTWKLNFISFSIIDSHWLECPFNPPWNVKHPIYFHRYMHLIEYIHVQKNMGVDIGTAVKVGTKADFIQVAEEHSSTFCAGVHCTTVITSSVHYLGTYVSARHVIAPLTLLLSKFHPLNDCDSTHVYIMLTESTFLSVSKISILLL